MGTSVIKLLGVSKKYHLGQIGSGTISGKLNAFFEGFSNKNGKETGLPNAGSIVKSDAFWSLEDINLTIEEGEVVGIIGKNGSGKSTLLKILSKITRPTKGIVGINGRLSSLLEVGTGFHPDLSGRQNIFLNGAILGMKKQEILKRFDEIVSFSGIEPFLDTPVKRYSSGMYVRLGFAVAAHLESEILIVDEVLAVGDFDFQQKCIGKMKDAAGRGKTILMVSHSIPSIKQLCNRAVLLEKGRMVIEGNVAEVISTYQGSGHQEKNGDRLLLPTDSVAYFTRWRLAGRQPGKEHVCHSREHLNIIGEVYSGRLLEQCEVRIAVKYDNFVIYSATSLDAQERVDFPIGKTSFNFGFEFPIWHAEFELEFNLLQRGHLIDCWFSSTRLTVLNDFNSKMNIGVLNVPSTFTIKDSSLYAYSQDQA